MSDVGQDPLHIRFAAAVVGDLAAAVHGHDEIGDPEHLFKGGGGHDDAVAVRAELLDQTIDVRTRPHVDATRRLVHEQHAGRIADRAAEGELLLVAAAELIGWRREPRAGEPPGGGQSRRGGSQSSSGENAEPAVKGDPRGNQVVSDAQAEEYAFAGAIFRDESELAGLRLRYRAQAQRFPGDAHLTGRVEREPRQRAHDLDGAGPDLPGKTDHRATWRDETEILDERRDAEALDHQHWPARLPVSARIHLGHAATEHHPHQLPAVDLIRTPGAHHLPVAQDRNRIAELKHLAEPVSDVDNGFTVRLERPQRIEDALDLDIGQRCRGLVEDEHPRVAREHPRELNKLPPADAEPRYRCLEREVAQAHRLERRTRALAQLPAAVEERHVAIAEPDR